MQTLRILIIESETNNSLSAQALEKNYHLDYARTESEGLRLLYRETYDVLFIDLHLSTGYLSGFQFVEYLRHLDRFKNLIIIGMSSDNDQMHLSFSKLNGFLLKPVSSRDLIETISQCHQPEHI